MHAQRQGPEGNYAENGLEDDINQDYA